MSANSGAYELGTVGDIISIAAQRVGAVSAIAGAVLEWREVR